MNQIKICGPQADKLYNRGFGSRDGKCIKLWWVESLYLVEKEMIKDYDFREIFEEGAKRVKNFDIRFFVYRDLRDRGYILRVKDKYFKGQKNYSLNFYPLSEGDFFEFRKFFESSLPVILSIVDGDGDITYYLVDREEPGGKNKNLPKKLKGEIIGERIIVFDEENSLKDTTYGKYEGKFSHLSLLEGKYLEEKKVMEKKLSKISSSSLYQLYRDLRERGLVVKSGFKYGTHFRVYERSMEEHSKYLVHHIEEKEEIQRISRAVRVSHGVKKELLLAREIDGKMGYLKVSWVRP